MIHVYADDVIEQLNDTCLCRRCDRTTKNINQYLNN